ncbi:MAG: hypothetical protein CUN56_13155 [Phototrophicales bacterium]|nr:MAG: hypothetical protein CUN56_13155 [Phototrophicales bacterium]
MTAINITEWEKAAHAVYAAESILIVTHIDPDGDAIGSLLGLMNGLKSLGKRVVGAVDAGVPALFHFLPGADEIQPKLERGEWDLMISTDASDEKRTGLVGDYGRAHSRAVINLDHHATNILFGDVYLVDSTACSAAEVVLRWFEQMELPLTREIAMPILTGIVTDTMGFRTSSVTAQTLEYAKTLMSAGASLTEITARVLDNRNFQTISLWKRALATTELHEGGIISSVITQADFTEVGTTEQSDQGLVGFLIKVEEAMMSVVFKELPDSKVNISMRAKPGFDVSQVAFGLGGGGHQQAAGATVEGELLAVKAQVIALLQEAVKHGKLTIV